MHSVESTRNAPVSLEGIMQELEVERDVWQRVRELYSSYLIGATTESFRVNKKEVTKCYCM